MRIKPSVKHINLSDFPRTPWAVSFGLRPALAKAFNYCRQYPDKMESLKAVLNFVMGKIAEWERSAQEVEFQGGSQKRPLMSATMVSVAVTTQSNGEITQFELPEQVVNDDIVHERVNPVMTEHQVTPAWVAGQPAMPTNNPQVQQVVEQPAQVQAQQVQAQPSVGGTYQPQMTLAEMLAQRAQQQ